MSDLPPPPAADSRSVIGMRRSAIKLRGWPLVLMAFQGLGIIYADLGTSPLYALNGIWPTTGDIPSEEDVIGGLSAIIWFLTLLPLLKYAFVALRYETHEGEGGPFALFQGLYPPDALETPEDCKHRAPRGLKWTFLIWALLGTSLTMADGIFTAAVSVTSAVGGIAVAKPEVTSDIVPISIAFLVALFIAQPFGTARLSAFYSPIAFLWFLFIAATGIFNITTHPAVWRACDPSRAVLYFIRTRKYDALLGVLLALTGCEALFANLGQFNMLSIQLCFGTFVYPSLILAYLGQGARLIEDGPNVINNIFYRSIPGSSNGPLFWILYVLAILATLIASQSIITAVFSLVQQLVNMRSLPPLRLVHTSDKVQGQVYVPSANWILAALTIIMVAVFKNLVQLSNAFGFAVSIVMFTTTVLLALQTHYVKRLPVIVAVAFFLFFGFFDGLLVGVAFRKIPQGAWVPLMIGLILLIIMVFWNWAQGLEEQFDNSSRQSLDGFIVPSGKAKDLKYLYASGNTTIVAEDSDNVSDSDVTLFYVVPSLDAEEDKSEKMGNVEREALCQIPSFAMFYKMAHERGVPHSFTGFIHRWPALPRFAIFLTIHVLPFGRVSQVNRYMVSKVANVPGVYGVVYYQGYRERVDIEVEEIVKRIHDLEFNINPQGAEEIMRQLSEVANWPTHVIPYYDFVSKPIVGGRLATIFDRVRAFLIEDIYQRLRILFPDTVNWLIKPNEIVHVGISAKI